MMLSFMFLKHREIPLSLTYLCVVLQCSVDVADGLHSLFKQADGLCHWDPKSQPVINRAEGAQLIRHA